MNMDPAYWKQYCLYPFSLKTDESDEDSPTHDKSSKVLENEVFINNPSFKFPLHKLQKGTEGVLMELQTPLQITIEEIITDLQKFVRGFPLDSIPHTVGGVVVDKVHNFERIQKESLNISPEIVKSLFPGNPGLAKKLQASSNLNSKTNKPKMVAKPLLTRDDIKAALFEIDSENFARFVGIMSHLIYWCLFGHINQVPLEDLYKKDLFIGAMQIKTDFESRYSGKKKFATLIMPLIILVIRLEMEVIFKNSYPMLFSDNSNEKIAMKLMNTVITKILDPNLFCSRFSFFESDKDAIQLKYRQSKRNAGLPALKAKYNGRSSLLETLIPVPSEGKIRKMFNEFDFKSPKSQLPKLTSLSKTRSNISLSKSNRTSVNKRGNFSLYNCIL